MYTLSLPHSREITVLFESNSESHEPVDIADTAEIAPESNISIVQSFHDLIWDPEFSRALQAEIAQMPASAQSYKLTLALKDILDYDKKREAIHATTQGELHSLQNTFTT